MTTTITVRDVPARPALLVHTSCRTDQLPASLGRIFGDVQRWAGAHAVRTAGPAVARYDSWDGGVCELDAGFVVDAAPPSPPPAGDAPIRAGQIGGCTAVCATHLGSYETLADTYAQMQAWMATHGYVPAGAMWEEYFSPPGTPTEQQRTELYWPVRKG